MIFKLPDIEKCTIAIVGLGYVGLPLALEFARNLYLGADFNFLYGNNEMTVLGNDKTYYYKPRYSGSNITLGLLHILYKNHN